LVEATYDPFDVANMAGQLYECARCGYVQKGEQFQLLGGVKCEVCGYRIVKKIRPPVVKRIPTK
jgi:DNA-directed RNA polymerase subunit RPC12/RpoP